jgi:hypothetical protein
VKTPIVFLLFTAARGGTLFSFCTDDDLKQPNKQNLSKQVYLADGYLI